MKKFLGIILAAIGIVVTALSIILQINGQTLTSTIGGPDGPTVIIDAVKIGSFSIIMGIIAGIALFAAGAFIIVRKK